MHDGVVLEIQGSPRIERLVDDYLASCRAKGLSPKTIKLAYGYPLKGVFVPWCGRVGVDALSDLTTRLLERFSAELMESGGKRGELSQNTVWSYVKAVRGFIAWAKVEGEDVDAEARLPRLPQRHIEVLTRDEVQRMEDVADSERDKLIVRVLADTGVRVGELVKLRERDLVEQSRTEAFLSVVGRSQGGGAKGDRYRMVPLSPALAKRIRRYVDRSRPGDATSDKLFVSRRRSANGGYEAITESGIQQMIRDLGERAAVRKRVHPHLFRHSAATFMLQRGMNPLLVAQVLGHSSLAMIQRVYAHLTPTDAHQALMQVLRADD
jgi:integrase/recombinase XerD